jgi:hypothetical protein
MKLFFEEIFIFVGSIVVGIPLGLIAGIVCWFKFPFQVYVQARANLALQRINKAKEKLKEYEDIDIWERHAQRMEEKKSYDN